MITATKYEAVIYAAQQRLTPEQVPNCPVCHHRTELAHSLKAGGYFWRCLRPGRFKCWGRRDIEDQDAFIAFATGVRS